MDELAVVLGENPSFDAAHTIDEADPLWLNGRGGPDCLPVRSLNARINLTGGRDVRAIRLDGSLVVWRPRIQKQLSRHKPSRRPFRNHRIAESLQRRESHTEFSLF